MKQYAFLIFCSLSSLVSKAQKSDTAKVTFHVTGRQYATYEVFPKDSLLWGAELNGIRIHASGKKREAYAVLEGGMISRQPGNDSMYIATVKDTVVSALLCIFEKGMFPDEKARLVYTKPYRIKRVPPPVLYVCGVKTDSVIDKQQLIEDDLLYAKSTSSKSPLLIESFDIIFVNGSSDRTLHSPSNHFTIDQRKEIRLLKPGNVIYFENVRCVLPKGVIITLKPVQIYVDETNKYRVGYRKTKE
jgi:hypothetical protein